MYCFFSNRDSAAKMPNFKKIKIVQENAALNKSFKVKILYVNNDAIFANAEGF